MAWLLREADTPGFFGDLYLLCPTVHQVPSKKSWGEHVQPYFTVASGVHKAEHETDATKITVLMPHERKHFCDQDLCGRCRLLGLGLTVFWGLKLFGSLCTSVVGIPTALHAVCAAEGSQVPSC